MKTKLTTILLLLSATLARAADPVAITVHTDKTTKNIDQRIYGQFLEHIFNSVHGGLWGDQILNGTLELRNKTPAVRAAAPTNWEFVGNKDEVKNDADNPFNADSSIHIERTGPGSTGIRQQKIAITANEKYSLTFYVRGQGTAKVTIDDGATNIFSQSLPIDHAAWTRIALDFTAPRAADSASLQITLDGPGALNLDQISLFSAAALATGGYRPDLLKAVADLQPATIRWPGGSFANKYIWENGIGPREKRLPHPAEQWGDRDPYQFGTDEFMQLCEKIGAQPIIVINTARGTDNALHWLEYCLGDATSEFGKQRAANGHAAPYKLKTIEIDNEAWLLMQYPKYLEIVNQFCPAIRAKYPALQLSVCGSYGYDTGPGEGNAAANKDWDVHILADAAKNFDILSPHYYNGIDFTADYVNDPLNYEKFLQSRAELIAKSTHPTIKLYVSEWNLTNGRWGNDWRVGLYAGGILNTFERQADIVQMTCPALFMRKIGVTKSWDNALINFDQKSWFGAGNYVVMKLWRESYAPHLLATEGAQLPLNYVATRSEDNKTVFVKMVNPQATDYPAKVTLDGDFQPHTATMQLIAPGGETVKNSIEKPDLIKATPAKANLDGKVISFTMPALSAGVVRIAQ